MTELAACMFALAGFLIVLCAVDSIGGRILDGYARHRRAVEALARVVDPPTPIDPMIGADR